MTDFKPWYASKTIWGAVVALLAAIASAFGVDIDQQMQANFVDTLLQLVAVGGSAIALFGRINATKLIE